MSNEIKNWMDLPVSDRRYYCTNCLCPDDRPDLENRLCGCGNPIHAVCYNCEHLLTDKENLRREN